MHTFTHQQVSARYSKLATPKFIKGVPTRPSAKASEYDEVSEYNDAEAEDGYVDGELDTRRGGRDRFPLRQSAELLLRSRSDLSPPNQSAYVTSPKTDPTSDELDPKSPNRPSSLLLSQSLYSIERTLSLIEATATPKSMKSIYSSSSSGSFNSPIFNRRGRSVIKI
jgi:hypothetical protein